MLYSDRGGRSEPDGMP